MKIALNDGTNLCDNTAEIDENSIFVKTQMNEKYLAKISRNLGGNSRNLGLDSAIQTKNAESANDSRARGSILEIKSGFCETSDEDRTRVHQGSELKQSTILAHPTGCEALAEAKKTIAQNLKIIEPSDLKNYLNLSPKLIGITGTNGKTTTASCIYSMLLTLGFRAMLIGTRGVFMNDEKIAPKGLTTPLLLELYSYIHLAGGQNCDFVIMEVSSHAIAQARIEGLEFALKILSNIQSDHLDFHKSKENYIAVKNSFFADSAMKLINKDCTLARFNVENAYTYGIENSANLKVEAYSVKDGINALISWNDFRAKISEKTALDSALVGRHNLYNLLCAVACVRLLLPNFSLQQITESLNEFGGVEGRMQVVHTNPLVIVDFAHTADGMQNIFEAFLGRKINVLFGAGGNRDKSKRPQMGKIAEIYAQKIYLTSDNPRDENPSEIINEILAGIKKREKVLIDENRKNAIFRALGEIKEDEILLILGKGDEAFQIIGQQKIPFDDREIVRNFYEK